MPRLTKKQSEAVKHLIIDCTIMRYSIDSIIAYCQRKLDITPSYTYVTHLRGKMRAESKAEFDKLRKDTFEFQYQYLQRMQEIRVMQTKLWEKYRNTDSDFIQINCIKELHSLTKSLAALYDGLPYITNANARYGNQLESMVSESEKTRTTTTTTTTEYDNNNDKNDDRGS